MDPVFKGTYPSDLRSDLQPPAELIEDGDMELISAPIDFFGLNYYRPHYVRSGDWSDLRIGETPVSGHPGVVQYLPPDLPRTVMGWPIVPEGMRDLLIRLHDESGGLPIYVTENGCAADDYISPEGRIDDYERVEFIHSHLDATLQAIDAGVNVGGYFHWSLMDNFEWAEGYRRRFGLHYVDFASGRRIQKRSARFYRQVALTGQLPASLDFAAGAEEPEIPEAPAAV
jgi:beta-glucosidase